MDQTAKGVGMDTVRRYSMLIDGAWVDTEEKFVRLDLSGRLAPRACPLQLGTPPA